MLRDPKRQVISAADEGLEDPLHLGASYVYSLVRAWEINACSLLDPACSWGLREF